MPTYTPLQSVQLTTSSTNVTFSGIPQIYQDLVIETSVLGVTGAGGTAIYLRFNGDSGNNYSHAILYGNGSTSASERQSNVPYIRVGARSGLNDTNPTLVIANINNYSRTTTFKSSLSRGNEASSIVEFGTGTWRNTSAISSVSIVADGGNFAAGSTFDLYGISPVAADTAQAFGGTEVFYDSTYVYHVFKGSGTFTPYRNLTADMLVVAGGGGGGGGWAGNHYGGGGGAGGFRTFTSQSLIANTSYAVTIGSGGPGGAAAGSNRGIDGTSSQFGSLTSSSGGGGGGSGSLTGNNGASGGGGGGALSNVSGGTGSAGQGNNGGTGIANYMAGGGGGAGAAGSNGNIPTTGNGGNGGIGSSSSISGGSVTGAGELSGGTYYFAGGGGGTPRDTGGLGGLGGGGDGGNGGVLSDVQAAQGTTNTGGGGGGGNAAPAPGGTGGSGGSGIVIVRYAR